MSRLNRMAHVWIAVAILVTVAGCASTATRTTYSDAKIADDVNARITRDATLNASGVGVTSQNGVVYLSGTVPSADRHTRATEIAYAVPGVRSVVNNMTIAVAGPAVPAVVVPPAPAVVVPPTTVVTVPGRIDATGVVSSYDAQNGIVTLQDGRMVKVLPDSVVSGTVGAPPMQPGTQVTLRSVQPLGYQQPAAPAGAGAWRLGTVSQVDGPNGLIYLTDGTVIRVGPGTALRSGNQVIPLTSLAPGSQVAVSMISPAPAAPAAVYSGSALPRQGVAPQDATEVRIFVIPR